MSTPRAPRSRLLCLLLIIGLAAPSLPADADDCSEGPGRPACGNEAAADTCRAAEAPQPAACCRVGDQGHDEPVEPTGPQRTPDDQDCCPSGCTCLCCGCAAMPALQMAPPACGWVMLAAASVPDLREAISPQNAVGELLHPPQA